MSMKMRRKSTRYKGLVYAVIFIAILLTTVVLIGVGIVVYDIISERQEPQPVISESIEETYTKQELDLRIAEAIEQTRTETRMQVEAETRDAVLESVKTSFLNEETTVEALRPLFPNDVVVVSNGQYHFVPINRNLNMHNLTQDNLRMDEEGVLSYVENENVISHKGIDVSKFQGKINWNKVKADGVEYAFIRVGLRGYGSGEIVDDATFERNIEGALDAGVKVGVYFFSQAVTVDEAIEEAEYVLDKIKDYDVTYPVVFDVEKVDDKKGRMNLISVEERTDVTIAFCETIKAAGYIPMIYANTEMYSVLLDFERLEAYEKWYAFYDPTIYFPYDFKIWQYSDKGRVNGISEPVDLNISFKTWGEE